VNKPVKVVQTDSDLTNVILNISQFHMSDLIFY